MITRIESTQSRVVCYWNTGEVKEGELKYNTERIRKTSQTMQLNKEIKQGKLNIRKINKNITNKSGKNNEKITIIHINSKMPALWDSKVTFVSVSQFWGLALYSPFGSVSGPFLTPCLIVSLGGRKKKGKKKREELKK